LGVFTVLTHKVWKSWVWLHWQWWNWIRLELCLDYCCDINQTAKELVISKLAQVGWTIYKVAFNKSYVAKGRPCGEQEKLVSCL